MNRLSLHIRYIYLIIFIQHTNTSVINWKETIISNRLLQKE